MVVQLLPPESEKSAQKIESRDYHFGEITPNLSGDGIIIISFLTSSRNNFCPQTILRVLPFVLSSFRLKTSANSLDMRLDHTQIAHFNHLSVSREEILSRLKRYVSLEMCNVSVSCVCRSDCDRRCLIHLLLMTVSISRDGLALESGRLSLPLAMNGDSHRTNIPRESQIVRVCAAGCSRARDVLSERDSPPRVAPAKVHHHRALEDATYGAGQSLC
jgi:hypothetical protein